MLADGDPAWLVAWRLQQGQPPAPPAPKPPPPPPPPGPHVLLRMRGQSFVIGIIEPEGDTPGTVCGRKLRHFPITEYQECLDWAVGIADQMARPIYVVPLNNNDILRTDRWNPYAAMLANLNDQERRELRRMVVTTAAEVMRDCDDPEVRADMHGVLHRLKVIG